MAALTALKHTEGWLGLSGVGLSEMQREIAGLRTADPHSLGALVVRYRNRLFRYHLRRIRPQSLDEPLPSGDTPASLLPAMPPGALESLLPVLWHVPARRHGYEALSGLEK